MNITKIVRNLISLAVKNPSEEEAKSAALKACKLIEQHSIPVGDGLVDRDTIFAPDASFMDMVADIIKGAGIDRAADIERDYPEAPSATPGAESLSIPERELEDKRSAFQRQTILAWRAIRKTRKDLEAEIHRYEQETHRKFTGNGSWM